MMVSKRSAGSLLKWLNTSRYGRLLILGLIVAAVAFGMNLRPQWGGDDTSHDLYTIQSAVIAYYNQNNSLPTSLSQLHISGLKHDLSAYTYSASTYGPTATDRLCANFSSSTVSNGDYNNSTDNTPGVYQHHRKGVQCFVNDMYKSQPHISLEKS